jgi:glyoxylase-like metal-dependent hydrolase (beta-lactamase superfamily II)
MHPEVTGFFDKETFTVSYVVADPKTKVCAIIDSVLDFDPASGRTRRKSADAMIAFIQKAGLKTDWVLETHVHADHLSAAPYLRQQLGGRIGIGFNVTAVQTVFGKVFGVEPEFRRDGSQFDKLFQDGERFAIGGIAAQALYTPGHTPACMTYVIGDAAFIGDTLFMPDYGTARCDFPGGDARQLYHSIQKIYTLPPETRLFLCHDYKAPGRDEFRWETTVAEQRAKNVHLRDGVTEDQFVKMRTERDATLSMPRLILPAVQVNMRAGNLPPAEKNGATYLKLPVDAF